MSWTRTAIGTGDSFQSEAEAIEAAAVARGSNQIAELHCQIINFGCVAAWRKLHDIADAAQGTDDEEEVYALVYQEDFMDLCLYREMAKEVQQRCTCEECTATASMSWAELDEAEVARRRVASQSPNLSGA
jgi:hypothetical protein